MAASQGRPSILSNYVNQQLAQNNTGLGGYSDGASSATPGAGTHQLGTPYSNSRLISPYDAGFRRTGLEQTRSNSRGKQSNPYSSQGGYLSQPPGVTRVTAACECCRAPIFPGELTLRPLSNMSMM
jgi:hypothetical protein